MRLRALTRALEVLGSPKRLATYLGKTTPEVMLLMQGPSNISDGIFLDIVNLLIANDGRQWNRGL
jgi:hypothetical protein